MSSSNNHTWSLCREVQLGMIMAIMAGYRLAMEGFVLCLAAISMDVVLLGGAAAAGVVLQLPHRPIFVFGDSTLDVGNNNYLPGTNVARANMPYYGVDFPGFPTGRFSNGYNTADFVAKCLGFLSSPPPYLSLVAPPSSGGVLATAAALTTGVNYASGGAGISINSGDNIPLPKQVQYFNATRSEMIAAVGSGKVRSLLASSVFLIGTGGQDVFVFANAEQAQNRSAEEQQGDAAAFYAGLVSNYSDIITDLHTLGMRKLAVVNAGLAGCLPVARVLDPTGACVERRNQIVAGFNDALGSLLRRLASTLPGFHYSLGDSLGFTAATFAYPQASGFTDIASACCGGGRLGAEADCRPNSTLCADRDRSYFWDRVQLSQRAAFLRAQAFCDGPAQYTTPINFKQLAYNYMT